MKIYLGNLSRDLTDSQLGELLAPFGKTNSAEVARERGTGVSKGFGFAEFPDDAEANAAIAALDGKEVGGQTLKVSESRPRK